MKKAFSMLLMLVLLLGMLPVSALAADDPQKVDGVYQIGTAAEMMWLVDQVNNGNGKLDVKLTADITLPQDWPGIGIRGDDRDVPNVPFSGTFDGDGHTVTFNDSKNGLFVCVMGKKNELAEIRNVTTLGTVKSSPFAANAGYATFTRCINKATVNATTAKTGGIVGVVLYETIAGVPYTDVRIMECGNEGEINGLSEVGGILGKTIESTRLNGCYNTGAINGKEIVGGLVGYMQSSSKVENCYNTGAVKGNELVGGIVGQMYNDTTISYCYNAGETYYAFTAYRFNHTSKIGMGCYFLGINSSKCSPDYTDTIRYDRNTAEIDSRAEAKTAAEMATAGFAAALGDAFKQSCPTPVLKWQTAVQHSGSPCHNCALGSTEKETYTVALQSGEGYTLTGAGKVDQGSIYTVSIALDEGYEKNRHTFAVKANGEAAQLMSSTDTTATYSIPQVSGPLSITVKGVQKYKNVYDITWSGVNNGYRINGIQTAKDQKDTVDRGAPYTFTLSFADGFKEHAHLFKVVAKEKVSEELLKQGAVPQEVVLTKKDGQYTIPAEYTFSDFQIIVSGLDTYNTDTATVSFRVTEGYDFFHVPTGRNANKKETGTNDIMAGVEIEVPYFDLALYGLERYYYNPNCYVTNGVLNTRQQIGNPELAYNNVTIMHAFIVATELFRLGYDETEVGQAKHRWDGGSNQNAFNDTDREKTMVSWSQDVGSSFMNFWTHGTNLNYYLNYIYPLAFSGWGSTSDQIKIKDGDDISVHLITGAGSGSRFGVFTVNDRDKKFEQTDIRDEYTVQQGQKVNLTLYWSGTGKKYSTVYDLVPNAELYWIEEGALSEDIRNWNKTDLGKSAVSLLNGEEDEELEDADIPAAMITDATGTITIDTAGVKPGTYYIAARGTYSPTGAMNEKDLPAPAEAGASLFKLTIEESEGLIGDVDGDGMFSALDATKILRYVVGTDKEINAYVADVDGDGKISATDATYVLRRVTGSITDFPANNK